MQITTLQHRENDWYGLNVMLQRLASDTASSLEMKSLMSSSEREAIRLGFMHEIHRNTYSN